MAFDLSNYAPVQQRIEKWYADHPDGRIVTELVSLADGIVVFKASVYRPGESEPMATGYAHEVEGDGHVNKTSALENCETSAIGRALANAGYPGSTGQRASREEMAGAERRAGRAGPPSCPGCGEAVTTDAKKHEGQVWHKDCIEGQEPF